MGRLILEEKISGAKIGKEESRFLFEKKNPFLREKRKEVEQRKGRWKLDALRSRGNLLGMVTAIFLFLVLSTILFHFLLIFLHYPVD